MRIASPIYLLVAAIGLGACWGCGSAGSSTMAELVPVKGKVTYKGEPVKQGTIIFEPDGYGRTARGKIQPDGTFVLGTNKEGDGAVRGSHRVAVVGTGIKSPRDAVAQKYKGVEGSGLSAEVDAEHGEFIFDLK